ncbi:hypothetical protein DRN86_04145 [Candidatus Geothermarchaeota archaeon]|nr:MAG: hypothetical protein DRN86_04145 [Candidatus Geothermarchaeota archaeon]
MKAIVMAGGKGRRLRTEKQLIEICGKPMISWVVEAVRNSSLIEEVVLAITKLVVKTREWALKNGLRIIYTSGKGYESDVLEAVRKVGSPAFIIPSDMPLISSQMIDRLIGMSENIKADIVTFAVPLRDYLKYGSIKSIVPIKCNKAECQPIGISLFNNSSCETWMTLIVDMSPEFINVNTLEELELARRYMKEDRL